MPIDASIPLQVRPQADPMQTYGKALSLRALATQQQLQDAQLADAQRARNERTTLADLYRGAVGPDGKIDSAKLYAGAAQAGLGYQIPVLRKQQGEAEKVAAEAGNLTSQTRDRDWGLLKKQLDATNAGLAALLSDPEGVTHEKVYEFLRNGVRSGLFTAEQGAAAARSVPGRAEDLRTFLLQRALESSDATKRIDMLLPKVSMQDTGGQIVPVDTNPITNSHPQAITKTMTPGEVATDARGRQSNAIAAGNLAVSRDRLEWDKTRPPSGTFVETSGGLVVGDSRTGTYRPAVPVGVPGAAQPQPSAGSAVLSTGQPAPIAAPARPADFGQPALGKPKAQLDAEVKTVERERAQQNAASVAADSLAVLDKAIMHPGRTISTGGTSLLMTDRIPGTDAADFRAVRKQLEGKAFLQAFESLKGGGQITEIEGRKGTEAIARLDTAQSDSEYLAALNELRDIMARGYKRATGTPYATQAPVPPDAARPAVRPPKVGQVIDGYLFKGGDPANPSSWVKP